MHVLRIPAHGAACALLVGACLSYSLPAIGATVSSGTDPEAQLPYWEVSDSGMSLRLVQRLPDQTRGFFQARGFSVSDSDHIAMNCVFQTIFRNLSPVSGGSAIEYDLREWTVHAGGSRRTPKTREDWKSVWSARKAPASAQIAFEWSLLPTRQHYEPGDFNWGMTLFGLAPGTVFDLDVVWHERGERRGVRFANIRCAPDVQPEPAVR